MQTLQRLLADRQRRAKELQAQRTALLNKLRTVESDLQRVLGTHGGRQVPAPKAPAAKLATAPDKRRVRPKNDKPLHQVLIDVLRAAPDKAMRLKQLTAAAQAAGYTSYAAKFENVVYQCLYNNPRFFSWNSTQGLWLLARHMQQGS